MGNVLTSYIRTIVPVTVGLGISTLSKLGIDLDPGPLTIVIDAVFIGAYYALARALEAKLPQLGWLLGAPHEPVYDAK
jgi:hypothetical protein